MQECKVGAIDLGSNSLRMLIALNKKNNLITLQSELRETRLGEKLQGGGSLHPAARARTQRGICELLGIIAAARVERGIVVATGAVRDATDGKSFLRELGEKSLYPVRLLSEREEACFGFQGALLNLGAKGDAKEDFLVLDLGGRSCEISWQDQGKFYFRSFSFGAVSLNDDFFPGQQKTAAGFQRLQSYVKQLLHTEKNLPLKAASRQVVVLGGTVTTLAALAMGIKEFAPGCVHGQKLVKKDLDVITQELRCSSTLQLQRLLPFAPRRAEIITAGAAALSATLEYLEKEMLQVSEQGVIHGVLLSL